MIYDRDDLLFGLGKYEYLYVSGKYTRNQCIENWISTRLSDGRWIKAKNRIENTMFSAEISVYSEVIIIYDLKREAFTKETLKRYSGTANYTVSS